MNANIKKIIQQPEVKELAITLIGISAGFVANRLLSLIVRRNVVAGMVGKLVQVGVTTWVSGHPEWIDEVTEILLPTRTKRKIA